MIIKHQAPKNYASLSMFSFIHLPKSANFTIAQSRSSLPHSSNRIPTKTFLFQHLDKFQKIQYYKDTLCKKKKKKEQLNNIHLGK
ncbi:hypothetical protein HanRHA438_Chr16g0780691 [Helianthus annuus]|nr:hypothetical protein HanRHA438_Chr16g0780691 [Helianthus annuus]